MTDSLTHFACTPLRCTLTPERCADRVVAAKRSGRRDEKVQRIQSATCAACEVGAAHRRGERPETWPDGSPVVRLTLTPQTQGQPRQAPSSLTCPTHGAEASPASAVPLEQRVGDSAEHGAPPAVGATTPPIAATPGARPRAARGALRRAVAGAVASVAVGLLMWGAR